MSEARYERRRARRAAGVSAIAQHYFIRGLGAQAQGRIEQAISWFGKAIVASPALVESHARLASSRLRKPRKVAALKIVHIMRTN
jgi:hypothetical protein